MENRTSVPALRHAAELADQRIGEMKAPATAATGRGVVRSRRTPYLGAG
jgi:hypothetical protein